MDAAIVLLVLCLMPCPVSTQRMGMNRGGFFRQNPIQGHDVNTGFSMVSPQNPTGFASPHFNTGGITHPRFNTGSDFLSNFNPGVNVPMNFNPGVNVPRNFNPGVNAPMNFNPGVNVPRNFNPGVNAPMNFNPGVNVPRNFNPGVNVPMNFNPGVNVPMNFNPGVNVPMNFNPGNSVPLTFQDGNTFPVNFNTGNNFPPNGNTGSINPVNFHTGNNFPPHFNTVNNFPPNFGGNMHGNVNTGNNIPQTVNNDGTVFPVHRHTNPMAPSFRSNSVPPNFNTQNTDTHVFNTGSNTHSDVIPGSAMSASGNPRSGNGIISVNGIQFEDPTGNGNTLTVDLGANQFSDFGVPMPNGSQTSDNGIRQTAQHPLDNNISLHAVDMHLRNQLGIPNDSEHFGATSLPAGTISGTTEPSVIQGSTNFGSTPSDMSQISAAEIGNLDVLLGSNNFETNANSASLLSQFQMNGQIMPSFVTNSGFGLSTTTPVTPFGRQTQMETTTQPTFPPFPLQQPVTPTTTFDLMGNDPFMFLGLNNMMDFDFMDGRFTNAFSNPLNPNTAFQMRVPAAPSFNFLTPPDFNIRNNGGVATSPDQTSSILQRNHVPSSFQQNQFQTQPNGFQTSNNRNVFQPQFDQNQFQTQLNQRQLNENQFQTQANQNQFQTMSNQMRSRDPFSENWNPVMARPSLPAGFQFLSGRNPDFPSRTTSSSRRGPWFDPTFGVMLDESKDPAVKMANIRKGYPKGNVQPISVGNDPKRAVRIRVMPRYPLPYHGYGNTARQQTF